MQRLLRVHVHVHLPLAWSGSRLGSLQGWEAGGKRDTPQEVHSQRPGGLGPSFLPPFPSSSHSNLASQAAAGDRAGACPGCLRRDSPWNVATLSLPLQHLRLWPCPGASQSPPHAWPFTYVPRLPPRPGRVETCLAAHGRTVAEGEQGLPDLSMELPTRSHSPSLASLPGLSMDLKAAPSTLHMPLSNAQCGGGSYWPTPVGVQSGRPSCLMSRLILGARPGAVLQGYSTPSHQRSSSVPGLQEGLDGASCPEMLAQGVCICVGGGWESDFLMVWTPPFQDWAVFMSVGGDAAPPGSSPSSQLGLSVALVGMGAGEFPQALIRTTWPNFRVEGSNPTSEPVRSVAPPFEGEGLLSPPLPPRSSPALSPLPFRLWTGSPCHTMLFCLSPPALCF